MVKKFNKGELSAKHRFALNRINNAIRNITDDDLIIALVDVDKKIRKLLYEEE